MLDTIEKKYPVEYCDCSIEEHPAVLNWKTIRNSEFFTVVFKPSLVLTEGKKPSWIEESLKVISEVEKMYGLENKGYISRADITIDLKRKLGEHQKTFRLFIECMSYTMGLNDTPCFETLLNKFQVGNLKIANRSNCLTIYNMEDKDRRGNTRIERRFLSRAEKKGDREALIDMSEKFLKEITMAESFIENVEEDYYSALMKRKEDTKDYYFKLTEFLCREDRFFLTNNIFKMVYSGSGYVDNPSKYLYDYRQKRPQGLGFVKRKDFNEFIEIISKVLKDDLKESFFRNKSE